MICAQMETPSPTFPFRYYPQQPRHPAVRTHHPSKESYASSRHGNLDPILSEEEGKQNTTSYTPNFTDSFLRVVIPTLPSLILASEGCHRGPTQHRYRDESQKYQLLFVHTASVSASVRAYSDRVGKGCTQNHLLAPSRHLRHLPATGAHLDYHDHQKTLTAQQQK